MNAEKIDFLLEFWISHGNSLWGGLEIGRIHMGNYAGPAPGDLQGIPQSYDPVHGVIYVLCEQCEHCG